MLGYDPIEAARAAAKAAMFRSLLWLAGGAIVTGWTYAAASPGGTYVVAWGALVFGGLQFLRALYYLMNPTALLSKAERQ